MSEDRDWRKKQRALVNALREASLYRGELRIEQLVKHLVTTVTVRELRDDASHRPERLVVAEELQALTSDLVLIVEDVDEECLVPVSVVDTQTLRLRLDEVTPASWRQRSRRRDSQPGDVVREQSALAPKGEIAATSAVPHRPVELELMIPELGRSVKLTTERFTIAGFHGVAVEHPIELPQSIGARLAASGIACVLTVLDAGRGLVEGRIATCDRVAWYNFLTHAVFGLDSRLRPSDARPITRLMLESRNYTERALRARVIREGAIAASYQLDTELPASRFRWLARHSDRHLIGHLMGIQASSRVWAAIDNVGSQSHAGRWNAQVVARWIRVFGELVAGLPLEPLVQWNFSVAAGVWTEFHAKVRSDRALVFAENTFISIVLANLVDDGAPRSGIEILPLNGREMFDELSRADVGSNIELLLGAVCEGCEPGSAFVATFEREYLKPYRRLYRLIRIGRDASYLLTFSNHPTWPSLNQGHNFHYLVPLGDAPPPTKALLQALGEDVRAAACEPFRVMYLGAECEYGAPWIDLLLTPAAMPLAADAAEAF